MSTYMASLSADDRERIHDEQRRYLDEVGPLPTAEAIARPIIDGLWALYDLHERAAALEWPRDQGEYVDETAALLALVERVCTLVRVGVGNCLLAEQRGMEHALDGVLREIAGTKPSRNRRLPRNGREHSRAAGALTRAELPSPPGGSRPPPSRPPSQGAGGFACQDWLALTTSVRRST